MSDLVVKNVDLFGDSVMAAKDKDGNIWAGVSWFCNALGMSKGQKDKQVQNVQTDEVLQRGATKLEAGVFDPNNENGDRILNDEEKKIVARIKKAWYNKYNKQ